LPDQREREQNRTALWAALGRLDSLLGGAIRVAEEAYGAAAANDPYRGMYIRPEDIPALLAREAGAPLLSGGSGAESQFPALDNLSEQCGLNTLDRDAILIALAPEVDLRYERLYAYLQDDVTKRKPGVDLVLNLLCATRDEKLEARARFAGDAPLLGSRILTLVSDPAALQPGLLAQFLKLDPGIVQNLMGDGEIDYRIRRYAKMREPKPDDRLPLDDSIWRIEALARSARERRESLIFYFQGSRTAAKLVTARAVAARLNTPLLEADLAPVAPEQFGDVAQLVLREATLKQALLYLEAGDLPREAARANELWTRLGAHKGVVILEGTKPWLAPPLPLVTVPFRGPNLASRRAQWQNHLSRNGVDAAAATVNELAARFRLDEPEIERAAGTVAKEMQVRGEPADRLLFTAARAQGARDLGPLAQRIEPVHRWKDLVLPQDRLDILREIANQARHRYRVYEEWGFDSKLSLGKGLTALFSGPPGTGKTMAAEVIASDLQLDLFKIDLSQVVSKYIGETEKNLSHVFARAGEGNCILFFDECDALFGKRTEVRDAHDRYANIEVAYLLQRIEEYEGLCIMATNFQQNLDPAFVRRIRFIVPIEFPDQDSRRKIWEGIWPEATPLSGEIDVDFLARQYKFAGGSIRNVAVSAAFLAVGDEESGRVEMKHILHAVRREIEKGGRSMSKSELGSFGGQPGGLS